MKKYSKFLHHRATFSGLVISENHVGNDFEVNTTHVFFLYFVRKKYSFHSPPSLSLHRKLKCICGAFLGVGGGGLWLLKTASEMSVRNGVVQVDLCLPQSAAENKHKNVSLVVSGRLQEILLHVNIVCCNRIENGGLLQNSVLAFCMYLSIFIWDSWWRGQISVGVNTLFYFTMSWLPFSYSQ